MNATVNRSSARPRLLIPQLRSFYEWAEPVSWLLVRLTVGLMMIPPMVLRGGGPYSLDRLIGREL